MLVCRTDQNKVQTSPDMSALLTFNDVTFVCVACEVPEVPQGQINERWSWALSFERIPSRHSSPFLWLRAGHKHSHLFFPTRQPAVWLCGNCGGFTGKTSALQLRFIKASAKPLPGALRRDGMRFSNLIARDNLKVFPQVGSRLQNVLRWPLGPACSTLSSHAVRA